MVREILTINIGQCGVQLGHTVWRQYCQEHNINEEGYKKDKLNDRSFLCFFEHTQSKQYIPRNLMVDLDPDSIDDIKSSKHSKIFNPEFLLSGNEDAANNFARGHYTVGKEIIDKVNDTIRKFVDNCDNFQGFVINHSVGGGTGSGLGALILERIHVDYRKKIKVGFEVYPSNNHKQNLSYSVVEPYNAILSTHWLLDHTEVSLIFDNRKIYDLCKNHLEVEQPTFNHLNSLICKHESSTTCYLRNEGELNGDLNEFQTNLVGFPRLHFIIPSMAPIINDIDIKKVYIKDAIGQILIDGFVRRYYSFPNNIQFDLLQYEPPLYKDIMTLLYQSYTDKFNDYLKKYYKLDVIYDLYEMSCDPDYFMVEIDDFDPEEERSMAISANFHGIYTKAKYINAAIQKLKMNNKVPINEWVPGFKVGLNRSFIPSIDGDIIIPHNTVTMNFNITGIRIFFSERVSKKYDLMYLQRAFVHWYVGEGMEESEFAEAREELGFLEKDYLEQVTDYDETDDEED